ncbi:MAG: MBL fold metallo-hydrolase [Chloroflexi bacterium]|nr:MBL fold metallo-hydrolase [Chloroflexota bacterium]
MKLTSYGAAGTVTGSMHLLEANGQRILFDCGLYQGKRQEAYERNRRLPFDAASIDAVILSHAHLDHVGNIPSLVKDGFRGLITCTAATSDLAKAMLMDSAKIQESDTAYVNKKRRRQNLPPVEPLYTVEEATASLKHFAGVGYDSPIPLGDGLRLTFHDAGHILGSAISDLTIRENGRVIRFAFSGDLGRPHPRILRPPATLDHADVLVMESTYGGREHEPPEQSDEALGRIVSETAARGGKVIIPAFAVGRTQEIVYALHRLCEDNRIPALPIYVDSPLAVNVTEVFRLHAECFNAETMRFIHDDQHHDAFGFNRLIYTRSVEESKALNDRREPMVIISASGMAEAGRIQHHLANNIGDPRSTILIVGYQAENTLGRRIADRVEKVRIYGEEFRLRAQVEVLHGYSAHAGHSELMDWARALNLPTVRDLFLVHGEPEASAALVKSLSEAGAPNARAAQAGVIVEL